MNVKYLKVINVLWFYKRIFYSEEMCIIQGQRASIYTAVHEKKVYTHTHHIYIHIHIYRYVCVHKEQMIKANGVKS